MISSNELNVDVLRVELVLDQGWFVCYDTMSQYKVSSHVESEAGLKTGVTNSLFSYFDDFVGLILILLDFFVFI